jgi:hypothetical protein|eukprot:COSAG02_NODE_3659_length_6408_cov_3.543192_1_plen_104_part_00
MAYVAGSVAPAMKPNYVLRSWREGGQNVGAWLDSADAFIAENMGALDTIYCSVVQLALQARLCTQTQECLSCCTASLSLIHSARWDRLARMGLAGRRPATRSA